MLLVGALLTACANKNEYHQMSSVAGNSSQASSSAAQGSTGSSDTQAAGGGQIAADPQGQENSSGQEAAGTVAEAGGAATGAEAAQPGPEDTYDVQNQSGGDVNATLWEGTYVSDSGETLTITERDEYSLTFAFSQCQISGIASKEGSEACYDGDDSNVIRFVLGGGTITVTVTNAEGYSTEGSPMVGTYVLA